MNMVEGDIIVSQEEINLMCDRLAAEISKDYAGKDLLLVGVLKGAFVFLADLARRLTIPVQIDFMDVSSYGAETKTSGIVKINSDLNHDITNRHVLIVEDIIDTGLTLKKLKELLLTRGPASLALCTAFDKPSRRTVDLAIEYRGIEVPNKFIIGYGLDFDDWFRNLPYVCEALEAPLEVRNEETN